MLTGVSSYRVIRTSFFERYTRLLMETSPEFPIPFLKIYSLGNVYISDRAGRFIWKIDPTHKATIIAGTGVPTYGNSLKTNIKAVDADLGSPEGLIVDQDNNILFADGLNRVILKIDGKGQLTRIAGNGERGFGGDSGPATEAMFSLPTDVRLDPKGNLYITDVLNHRIRMVNRHGVISTVAGRGVAGYSGDGGPAVDARLNTPWGVLLDQKDNLFIADSENHVIRKVSPDGIITTIAGSGRRGFSEDGAPALVARFDTPQSLAMDAEGRLYIGDEHNNAIRVLELDGTIRTLVGSRGAGYAGDGGPASEAQIWDPENLWIRKDGSMLITARDNARVRSISPEGIINTWAGRGPSMEHSFSFTPPLPREPCN
jgi:sugar lactone lactonase YvrE